MQHIEYTVTFEGDTQQYKAYCLWDGLPACKELSHVYDAILKTANINTYLSSASNRLIIVGEPVYSTDLMFLLTEDCENPITTKIPSGILYEYEGMGQVSLDDPSNILDTISYEVFDTPKLEDLANKYRYEYRQYPKDGVMTQYVKLHLIYFEGEELEEYRQALLDDIGDSMELKDKCLRALLKGFDIYDYISFPMTIIEDQLQWLED